MCVMQETEPLLASFLHTNILAHQSLAKALSHLLASKMQSRTLLGTQLMRLIFDAYQEEPVSFPVVITSFVVVKSSMLHLCICAFSSDCLGVCRAS